MPSIVDAIKQKHPEATGNTIAEVIRTSESGGSGGGGTTGEPFVLHVVRGSMGAFDGFEESKVDIYNAIKAGKKLVLWEDSSGGTAISNYTLMANSINFYTSDDYDVTEYGFKITFYYIKATNDDRSIKYYSANFGSVGYDDVFIAGSSNLN